MTIDKNQENVKPGRRDDAAQQGERINGHDDEVARFHAVLNPSAIPAIAPVIIPPPTPGIFRPEEKIPYRDFLYGDHYIRGYVSMTAAPGGTGKTAVAIAEAVSMATTRALLGPSLRPRRPLRVWYLGEDDKTELERRFVACMKLHGVAEFERRGLFVDSLDSLELVVFDGDEDLAMPAPQTRSQLIAHILHYKIDVVIVDPFADTHTIDENRNGLIGRAVLAWRKIARGGDCAIELITHTRKPVAGLPASIEDARGGRAQIDRARHGRILIKMTKEEAAALLLEESEAFRYVRFGEPKANMGPSKSGEWMKLESVFLQNGLADLVPGDNIQVASYWKSPKTFDDISKIQCDAVMREIETCDYRVSVNSPDWIGHLISEKMGIPLTGAGKVRIKDMLFQWEKNGAIRRVILKDKNRDDRPFYRIGNWEYSK